MLFDNFKLYDQKDQPLSINGSVDVTDPIGYNLDIVSENFTLFNKPDSATMLLYRC